MAKLNEIPYSDLEEKGKCGSGSFSQVYRAFWKTGSRIVALKKFLRLQVTEEAEVLSQLSHRNIVKFIGVVTDPRVCGIVTEYIENGSLYDFLHASPDANANGAGSNVQPVNGAPKHDVLPLKDELNFSQLVSMASDIACGMNYLHSEAPVQVVHHDLKSKNVLLTSSRRCKICDFGSAQLGAATSRSSLAGTYAWMAPEVMKNETVNEKCDVYSFGVVVWELTTREVPFAKLRGEQILWNVAFRGERLPVGLNCPADLAELMRLCWKDQDARPAFSAIQTRLAEMAGNAQLVASANTFMADRAAFARENEAFRQRLLALERELQDRKSELAVRAERLRVRENELEQQFKVPKLEEYDVNMWRDIDVYEWIRHLRMDATQSGYLTPEQLTAYANFFLHNNITGDQLLTLNYGQLERLGVKSVGHQKTIRDRITALSRENRLNQHFPTLSSVTNSFSLPSPLGSAALVSDRTVVHRQFTRLTFVFGMHLAECRSDHRSHSHTCEGTTDTDLHSVESVSYKFKLYADVLEDEKEPSVTAPMFLIRRIEFRYDPPANRPAKANGALPRTAAAQTNAEWKVQVDRPPYITPEWMTLHMPTQPTESGSSVLSSTLGSTTNAHGNACGGTSAHANGPQADEVVFPDEYVSVRIEFWPKYVRIPAKVEHRHAFVFERARVRCTSHDLEAAARERNAPVKNRRKSAIQNNAAHGTSSSAASESLHANAQTQNSQSVASNQFQPNCKFLKNRLVPNYSEMTVTLELQQAARNAAGDFAAELRREQALEAQEESETHSRHSGRVDLPDPTDTICTTAGTVYSCASPMSTRMSTPNNTNREFPIALPGYYPPAQSSSASAMSPYLVDEPSPYEKMTYARAAAHNPHSGNRGAPPQLTTLSSSRSRTNLSRLSSMSGTYQSANQHNVTTGSSPSFTNVSAAVNSPVASPSNNWSRVASAGRSNTNTNVSPLAAGTGYHNLPANSAQTPNSNSVSTNQTTSTGPNTRLNVITSANRDRLTLNLNSPLNTAGTPPVGSSSSIHVSTSHKPNDRLFGGGASNGSALLRPVSMAANLTEADRMQRAEMMLEQGHYRSALSNELVFNTPNGNSLSNQLALAVSRQPPPILSPARESELPTLTTAATQTDTVIIATKTKVKVSDGFTQTEQSLEQTAASATQQQPVPSIPPQEQRDRGAKRNRGRQLASTTVGRKLLMNGEPTLIAAVNNPINISMHPKTQKVADDVTNATPPYVIGASLVQAVANVNGDLNSSMNSLVSVSSRKSTLSESTTTTSDTLTQPSTCGNDQDEADCDDFESAASTLSVETTLGRTTSDLGARSRDPFQSLSLAARLENLRLDGNSEANSTAASPPSPFARARQMLSNSDRSHSEMSALRDVPKGPRRRRGRKANHTPLWSNVTDKNLDLSASPTNESQNTIADDWTTVSRKSRLRLITTPNGNQRDNSNTSGAQEHSRNNGSSQLPATETLLPIHSNATPLSPTSTTRPTLAPSVHHLNSIRSQALTDSKDTVRQTESQQTSLRQGAPSTPNSPTPADVPPGLQGHGNPFHNVMPRNRHSSNSEWDSVNPTVHDKDRDGKGSQLNPRPLLLSRR